MTDESDAEGEVIVRFRLRLGGRPFEAEAGVPAGPARVSQLLPVLQGLASGVVDAAVSAREAEGERVSCGPGCGACCRQPVPIAASEAVLIGELLDAMPEERRRRTEARFEAACEELERAGLMESLRGLDDLPDAEARQALGRAYFELGIACPFLEDESCGIHADRPLACREYLVTSPAERCQDPDPEGIELVEIPVRPSVALFRFGAGGPGGEAHSIVMTLAREWLAGREDADPERGTGPELLESYVRGLAGEGP
jgi:Fe-S-cluster containining protein